MNKLKNSMKSFPVIMLVSLLIVSCASGRTRNNGEKARLVSENLVLKRQMTAIERRNRLLEDENNQMRKNVKLKEAEVEKITSDLNSTREQAEKAKILADANYTNLNKKYRILETQSRGKIKELAALNSQLEKKMSEKVKLLNREIAANKEESALRIEKMKKEKADREFEIKKEMLKKDESIQELNKEKEILSANLEEEKKRLLKEVELRKEKEEKVKTLEMEILDLKKKISSLEKGKALLENDKKALKSELDKKNKEREAGKTGK